MTYGCKEIDLFNSLALMSEDCINDAEAIRDEVEEEEGHVDLSSYSKDRLEAADDYDFSADLLAIVADTLDLPFGTRSSENNRIKKLKDHIESVNKMMEYLK